MPGLLKQAFRLAALVLVVAGVAALSDRPMHQSLPEGTGILTLSFSHGASREALCRKLTPEELAKLPANMRRAEHCPRGRPSVLVELEVDGVRLFSADVPPSGIAGDGPSRVYERFALPAGVHDVAVRLRDRPGTADFTYAAERRIELAPAARRVIDFRAESGGFVFH